MKDLWIIIIASLAAINCGLIGTYLVLRKMTMMGDAIAHATLPGLVIALLWTGSKSSLIMLLGAGSMGVLVAVLVTFLDKKAGLQSDAAIGINFTWLFAVGIILISSFSKKIDLDPECSLYGDIACAPLDLLSSASGINLGPYSFYVLLLMLILNISFITISYKQLFITTFDPAYASTIGVHTVLWHYLLMGITSFTTVATFEVAGAILVVALLVVPPATAYLITQRLISMLAITVLLGIVIAIGGYYLTVWINGAIASAMVTVAGCLFLLTFLLQKVNKRVNFLSYLYKNFSRKN